MIQAGLTLKDRIDKVLKECSAILSESDLSQLKEEIVLSEKRLTQPMQLAIIGKISSSKSTLVNAILGQAEVVRTGQMEETFNVSWLKYGDSNSNVNVVFKNGQTKSVPRGEWLEWTSHQVSNVLKEQVKYIEVFYEHEILKSINIIDTPGLDALSQIDSKNTIAFLKEIRPDAVVMLFTKSIAETTLSVLEDFQNAENGNFSLSAMNAIGILSKADTIWSIMEPNKDIIDVGNRVITTTLYEKYPEVRKSLFSILPVSSLMGLASSTFDEYDLKTIIQLSLIDDAVLYEMLSSPDFFIDEDYKVGVKPNERKRIYEKLGIYGIYILIQYVRRNKDASIQSLSNVLSEKSGFSKFLLTIQSHFGNRAILIKSQSILNRLLKEINFVKNNRVGETYSAVAKVESAIVSTILSLHEYKEWELLCKYYDGKIELSKEEAEEFVSLCGERGYSAPERLMSKHALSLNEMEEIASRRARYWQKQYNIYSVIEPDKASFYKLLISSYNILLMEIREAMKEYNEAKATLARTSSFLGL